MTGRIALRGQPLLLFVGLIASWSSVRAMTWHVPETHAYSEPASVAMPSDAVGAEPASSPRAAYDSAHMTWVRRPFGEILWAEPSSARPLAVWEIAREPEQAGRFGWSVSSGPTHPAAADVSVAASQHPSAAYDMPLATSLWESPLSGAFRALLEGNADRPSDGSLAANNFVPPPLPGDTDRPASPRRFSIDSWMLVRRDGSSAPVAIGGSYGRSQAGMVARYDLIPRSPHQPRAYVRATRSLDGPQEGEVAVGLSGRPIPGIPVLLAGEARYYRTPAHEEFRPSVYAVTQLQPQRLPMDFRAETYFQGGYVGGQYATPFIDGQVRVDRKLLLLGDVELRAGGGAWGGAQKGAQRLDVGPGMSLYFGNGSLNSRLSLDYRFRVAGDAAPASGPALTLSAGF